MINNLSEKQIVKLWQQQLLSRSELVTEGGEPVKVIYPGRLNDDRGADFCDAVIATSRGLIKGDIELHIKSSGWRIHQHHLNPAYNRVILHVVMWHDTGAATTPQNGKSIPILALHKYAKNPFDQQSDEVYPSVTLNMPCLKVAERLTASTIAGFLDSAGGERFLLKTFRFQVDLAEMGVSQSLYKGIMGALGYAKNKLPCLELARRLPLQFLESTPRDRISDEECLAQQQALLLGTAGLLPSQYHDGLRGNKLDTRWIDRVERLWAVSRHSEVMSRNDWYLFKVRPSNFPVRRLVAMSYLILRYKEKGMLEALINMVKEVQVSQGHHRLEEGLLVTTNGYWANHFDFGLSSRVRTPTLLGDGRAADIIVNVLLPLTFAWSRLTSQPGLNKKALDLYCNYPKLAANSVERHMRHQLELNTSLVNSARRQQGLIHIYNTLCTQGRCNCCLLS